MKVALVASSYLPTRGAVERHVEHLARGLASRGVSVEILTQAAVHRTEHYATADGVIVRRFPGEVGRLRSPLAPPLWREMRLAADAFDLVDVHSSNVALALAAVHVGFRRLVITPHFPVERLGGWPYGRAARAAAGNVDAFVCTSAAERAALTRILPSAAEQAEALPIGTDVARIRAAAPFATTGEVVLSVGRLDREKRVDRAIAALPSLADDFRLTVSGDGPDRHRLRAYASDLRVAARVQFVGQIPDPLLYRWLRTAHVVAVLAEEDSSAVHMLEALAAGAAVVASDIPVHREAAAQAGGAGVRFVSPHGSPLEVADAIAALAADRRSGVPAAERPSIATWDATIERTLEIYRRLNVERGQPSRREDRERSVALPVRIRSRAQGGVA